MFWPGVLTSNDKSSFRLPWQHLPFAYGGSCIHAQGSQGWSRHEECADSAGTGAWHIGEQPHKGTRSLLAEKNIDYIHKGRALTASDYAEFDLILTMDEDNFRQASRKGNGRAEIKRFLEFAPCCGYSEVPDPWYTGNFHQTHDLVSEAADGLLAYIQKRFSM